MAPDEASLTSKVENLYRSAGADPELSRLLGFVDSGSDDEVAELIEVDGRTRIMLRREVRLDRYLTSIPDLAERELVLDAAIDVVLRSMSGGARPTRRAVDELTAAYPNLAGAIGDAALLGRAVVSTTGMSQLVRATPQRQVPSDFGPVDESGRARYQLTKVLGAGSSGEVYLAIDRLLSESDRPAQVAIKVIGSQSRSTRARLQLAEEASKARRVLHDNVVRVLDRGVSDEGDDYIVYDHIEGGDLDKWLEQNGPRVPPRRAAALVAKIARGLQAAHLAGLVHCDLKPSNVLVTQDGEPKVADFGIALRESDLAAHADREIRPMGNVAFMSPEQYRGEAGAIGPVSDVYALGGILYFLLTAVLPNGASVEEIARTHEAKLGRSLAPDPRAHRSEVDEDLSAICRRAMAVLPADRYSSASALAEDLESWLRFEPISWRRPSLLKIVRLSAKRRPALAVTIAIAVVSALAGAGGIGYWVSVASRNKSKADALGLSIDQAQDHVTWMYRSLVTLSEMGFQENLLPITVAMESISGAVVLGTPEQRQILWKARIDNVRQRVKLLNEAGRQLDFETLAWQAILAFWLVNAHQHGEAVELLDLTISRWREKGESKDSLLIQTQRLRAAARAIQLAEAARSRELSDAERSSLVQLRLDIEQSINSRGLLGGIPTRGVLLEAWVAILGPGLLNEPEALRVAEAKLKRHKAFAGESWADVLADKLAPATKGGK